MNFHFNVYLKINFKGNINVQLDVHIDFCINVYNKLSWDCHTQRYKLRYIDIYISTGANYYRTYFVDGGTIGVRTPHNIERETKLGGQFGSALSGKNTTSWLHLASWNLPDSQLSSESKMEPECGNIPCISGRVAGD